MRFMIGKDVRRFTRGVVLTALLAAAGAMAYASCNYYSNSRISYFGGQAVCAGYGSGCTECTDGGGGSCVTNGMTCGPFQQH